MTIVDRRSSVAEGTAVKAPCRVATTANITLSGLQTIDGVTLVADDRVLVKDQTTASQNGIYSASSGNWTRTRDFDGAYDIVQGTRVFVTAGTTLAGNEYYVSTSGTITIDSSSIAFTQMPASGIAASVAAAAASASTASSAASASNASAIAAAASAATFNLSTPVSGAAANGSTDDRAAIQSTIDAVAAAGGGYVHLAPGKTYRVVINTGVTDLGLIMKNGVTLFLNNSTINLECTGSVYGIRLQSNSHVIGPGAVKVTVSSSPGSGGCYHTPISAAAMYGEVTSVGALGNYINASNWSVRRLTLDNVRSDGNGFCFSVVGGQNHGVVEDIVIPDNSTVFCGIGCDWGSVGSINSSNFTTSRAAWDLGTAYTVHPHDIVIQRISIGALTGTGSTGVRLSGCYDIKVQDVEVYSTKGDGFAHHGGDCGFEFAKPAPNFARWSFRGTVIRNYHVYDATTGVGFLVDCHADNLATAISGGYLNISQPIGTTDILLDGCRVWSTGGASAGRGFWIQNMIGGTMHNCLSYLGSYGLNIEQGVDDFLIDGGEFAYSQLDGINIGNSDSPQDIAVIGAHLWGNGQTGSGYAGIFLGNCLRPRVERCIMGTRGGDSTQSYGVNIDTSCSRATVRDNYVAGVKAAGTGMVLAGSSDYTCLDIVCGNGFDASVTSKMSGVVIIPYAVLHTVAGDRARQWTARRANLTTGITPSSGSWVAGDTIFYADPTAGSYIGTVCVVAGAQGTWKNFGATPP